MQTKYGHIQEVRNVAPPPTSSYYSTNYNEGVNSQYSGSGAYNNGQMSSNIYNRYVPYNPAAESHAGNDFFLSQNPYPIPLNNQMPNVSPPPIPQIFNPAEKPIAQPTPVPPSVSSILQAPQSDRSVSSTSVNSSPSPVLINDKGPVVLTNNDTPFIQVQKFTKN